MIARLMCRLGYHDWDFDSQATVPLWRCWCNGCRSWVPGDMLEYPKRSGK